MILNMWRARRVRRRQAEALYRAVMNRTRRPDFYVHGGIPDTFEGRFDLLVVHVSLVLFRFKDEGEWGKALGQTVFDLFFADMDAALREMGVGDTSVGKRIREMSEAFYGRLEAYDEGLKAEDDEVLRRALERNLYGEESNIDPAVMAAMAHYMRAAANHMKTVDLKSTDPGPLFPELPDFAAASRTAEGVR